jgi:hypothetical protein
MGTSETTGHTTIGSTTRRITPAGIEMSQETNLRPIHRLSCTLTGTINNIITALPTSLHFPWHFTLRQTTPPIGGRETTSVMDNVSKEIKNAPHPVFFSSFSFFSRAGGSGSLYDEFDD